MKTFIVKVEGERHDKTGVFTYVVEAETDAEAIGKASMFQSVMLLDHVSNITTVS